MTTTSAKTDVLDRRVSLAALPTPLQPLDRLGAHLGMVPGSLWVKRDDLTGLAGGGNKTRKLEYLCADALARGCDTLVTGAAVQSNHCRQTAAAARRLGVECFLVLGGERPSSASGNLLLDRLLGAHVEFVDGDVEAAIAARCDQLEASGRKPAFITIGGSDAIGGLGYVRAADELIEQLPDVETIVVATGSCGTHAGLAAGLGSYDRLLGIRIGERADLEDRVETIAVDVAKLAGRPEPHGRPRIDHRHIGGGYGAVTEETREAIELAAELEALILDPVYTGKTMAGLIANVREGTIGASTRTVFLHTGGVPALFADRYHDTWKLQP